MIPGLCGFMPPAEVKGQAEFTTTGVHDWVVPPGVEAISVFGQAGGGGSASKRNSLGQKVDGTGAGAAGGSVYAYIPVTAGETLQVTIPAGGTSNSTLSPIPRDATGGDGSDFILKRGATVLVQAYGGQGGRTGNAPNWATGGSYYVNTTHVDLAKPYGGADGGRGGYGSVPDGDGGGGAPGGYSGTGGDGAAYPGQPAGAPSASSGGASGGGGNYGGGGIGIYGKGATAGSPGTDNPGTGGSGGGNADAGVSPTVGRGGLYGSGSALEQPGRQGAARIIWGLGRYYPDTNTGDV